MGKKNPKYDPAKRRERHLTKKATAAERLQQKLASLGDEALLDEYEAAELVGMSIQWMRNRRVNGGSLPYLKIGAAVRYRVADIKAGMQPRCGGDAAA